MTRATSERCTGDRSVALKVRGRGGYLFVQSTLVIVQHTRRHETLGHCLRRSVHALTRDSHTLATVLLAMSFACAVPPRSASALSHTHTHTTHLLCKCSLPKPRSSQLPRCRRTPTAYSISTVPPAPAPSPMPPGAPLCARLPSPDARARESLGLHRNRTLTPQVQVASSLTHVSTSRD